MLQGVAGDKLSNHFPYRQQIGHQTFRFFPNWTPKFMAPWPWCRICNLVRGRFDTENLGRIFSYENSGEIASLAEIGKRWSGRLLVSWLERAVDFLIFLRSDERWRWLNHTISSPWSSIITCEWWMFFFGLLRRRSATPWGWGMKRSPIPNGDIRNRWQPRLGARCESWCWWYFIPKSELSLLFHASLDVIQVWRGQVQAVAEKQKRQEKRLLAW